MNLFNKDKENVHNYWLLFVMSLCAGIIAVLADVFFIGSATGISFTLFVLLILVFQYGFAHAYKKPIAMFHWAIGLLAFVFAGMVMVLESELLTVLNILGSLLLLLLLARSLSQERITTFTLKDYILIPFSFFSNARKGMDTIKELHDAKSIIKKHHRLKEVVWGVSITLPILLILILLLASADPIFGSYVDSVFSFDLGTIPQRLVFIGFIWLVLAGSTWYMRKGPQQIEKEQRVSGTLGIVESGIFLGAVNVLFFVFLAIQFKYLFGSATDLSEFNVTFAEYAREGFFQLLVVASLVFVSLYSFHSRFHEKSQAYYHMFNGGAAVLIAQTMIIMASASKRLSLYEMEFGFTTMRLYSHVFVVFLACVFGWLLFKMILKLSLQKFALGCFTLVCGFLLFMNILNPDQFITKKNIARYDDTGRFDFGYHMNGLSADALPVLLDRWDATALRNSLKYEYHGVWYRESRLGQDEYHTWQAFNFSRADAMRLLDIDGPTSEFLELPEAL